jgi:hypothetical protein
MNRKQRERKRKKARQHTEEWRHVSATTKVKRKQPKKPKER